MSPVSKNRLIRYEWVLICATRPVRKVWSTNAVTSSDCKFILCRLKAYAYSKPRSAVALVSAWALHIFAVGPFPLRHYRVHLTSLTCWMIPGLPVFRALPLPCIILNANRRTKTGGHMEKQETEMKWKLETETGNGNGNKRRPNDWCNIFFIVCLVITWVFYLAIVMGLALWVMLCLYSCTVLCDYCF